MELLNDFLRYIKIDTQSSEDSNDTPSTSKQIVLLNLLKEELINLGVDAEIDEYFRVYAHIDGNANYPSIGLCAHADTALECSGIVHPQVISNYDLKDIKLGDSGLVLSTKEFPHLLDFKGCTLITTDGTSLLGADDKAGIAIIMNLVKEYLSIDKNNRKPLSILFTPDEEVGRGPEHFNVNKFKAKFAYTIDGASPKYIAFENFNANSCDIEIIGKSIHPGDAKNVMINASLVLTEFISYLDKDMIPSRTSGREGFNHLCAIEGGVEHANASYIIRNHDRNILNKQIESFKIAKEKTLQNNPNAIINLTFKEQYKNMAEIIKEYPEAKITIEDVYNRLGLSYEYEPIRGGTDGATFSFMGVPTPNLGTGSYNHHGKFEFAVLEEMELMVNILKELYIIK